MSDLDAFRRAPEGWTPARAMPVQLQVYEDPRVNRNDNDGHQIETSVQLEALWEVQIPGQQPYQLQDTRKAPLWAQEGGLLGTGDRWYKRRLKPTHGLLASLGVPCLVNPADPRQLWIDWDAAYDEHVPAWDRQAAVDREVASRQGGLDKVLNRTLNPFAPKLSPEEQHLADQAIAAQKAQEDATIQQWQAWGIQQMNQMGYTTAPLTEQGQIDAQTAETSRLLGMGTPTPATVVSCTYTEQRLANQPVYEVHLDVHDTNPPRRVVLTRVLAPAVASTYVPGSGTTVRVDPGDPAKLALG